MSTQYFDPLLAIHFYTQKKEEKTLSAGPQPGQMERGFNPDYKLKTYQ